jgi:hypothetical protein
MKKLVRLTEKDIKMLVNKIIRESDSGDGEKDDFPEYEGRTDIYADNAGVENKEDPEQNLTERRYRRLSNRRVNENVSDRKSDLYSSINRLINGEFDDLEPSDIVEILSNILRHHESESYRKKKGIGYITKDEVIKNFKKNYN